MASTAEMILFGCVAVVMVACALGVLFFKKAAYAALSMVGVMIGLAVLYLAHGAAFLGTVQIVVYTGAIMMLFLFVIMMIGLGASDEYQVQGAGPIVASVFGGLGLVVLSLGVLGHTNMGTAVVETGIDPYSDAPVENLALDLFTNHWFSMELAGALLVTAAVGAMLLTHSDHLGIRFDQRGVAEAKMRAFKERGRHVGQLPAPGVYAHSNAVDVPALSGETLGPVTESVPRVLRVKGLDRSISQVDESIAASLALVRAGRVAESDFARDASAKVPRSGAWGMPGARAPQGLAQPSAHIDQPAAPAAPAAPATEAPLVATTEEEQK
ncbi:NADH-quinone oxidoreductase subunit J [Schaalia sp. 19OD2882]|uniref:NADH-quinone oxidoreductase subunit J n=1 Tax=Schaalia sp. 19OD2882 TaxID=2794089 RepID=UPI001C1EEC8F|nr:NADH-quinone oxidoreductase subunit J [Schaalia sp. 19OD2882]QWW20582.1 NADH-quinone oxidoreductase subunit J [Schaalia sp. 19OD2882]